VKILLTGSTGFIGQRIVQKLSSQGHHLYLLVRQNSRVKAEHLFSHLEKITFITGDIINPQVVADAATFQDFNDVECLVHLAALYEIDCDFDQAYLMNVLGTQHIINLSKRMNSLRFFHYFSTYAVNPILQGTVEESQLANEDAPFKDYYSKTKNMAEHLVRDQMNTPIRTIIHRPGIIIGETTTGKMDKIDGPYYFFKFLKSLKKAAPLINKFKVLPLPVVHEALLPLLPVDVLVDWSSRIINEPPQRAISTYHLLPAERIRTTDFMNAAMSELQLTLKVYPLGCIALFTKLFPLLKLPGELTFYMQQSADFQRTSLEADYPDLGVESYHDYLPQIIKGFLKIS
jgi:thioester reductase-like protein